MAKELAVREPQPGLPAELEVNQVLAQVKKIQIVMNKLMKENVHYGVIPGTPRPTLYKPGAEKLLLMFRLDPEYEELDGTIEEAGYIHIKMRCTLFHIPTGNRMGSGMGSCNSREVKYRYRWTPGEKPDEVTEKRLKAEGIGKWKKDDEAKWHWLNRVDNEEPADLHNTIFKMACKRALIAAVLNVTAASDIFHQDLEDLPEGIVDPDSQARPGEMPPAGRGKSKLDKQTDKMKASQPPPAAKKKEPERKPESASDGEWTEVLIKKTVLVVTGDGDQYVKATIELKDGKGITAFSSGKEVEDALMNLEEEIRQLWLVQKGNGTWVIKGIKEA